MGLWRGLRENAACCERGGRFGSVKVGSDGSKVRSMGEENIEAEAVGGEGKARV